MEGGIIVTGVIELDGTILDTHYFIHLGRNEKIEGGGFLGKKIDKSVKKEISLQIRELTETEVKFIELIEAESIRGPKLWIVPFDKFKEAIDNKALIFNENDTITYNYYQKTNTNTKSKWKKQSKSSSPSQESNSQTEFGY